MRRCTDVRCGAVGFFGPSANSVPSTAVAIGEQDFRLLIEAYHRRTMVKRRTRRSDRSEYPQGVGPPGKVFSACTFGPAFAFWRLSPHGVYRSLDQCH